MTDPDKISSPTIQTFLGERFDIFRPDPRKIHHKDIAHALSMICRYGGHSSRFYSVAEHSVIMAEYFDNKGHRDLARIALFHDATEAYMGDVVRPMKLQLPEYRAAETVLQQQIFTKYDLPLEIPYLIKDADLRITIDERAELMHDEHWPGIDELGALDVDIRFWSPEQAEQKWLDLFFDYSFWSYNTGALG